MGTWGIYFVFWNTIQYYLIYFCPVVFWYIIIVAFLNLGFLLLFLLSDCLALQYTPGSFLYEMIILLTKAQSLFRFPLFIHIMSFFSFGILARTPVAFSQLKYKAAVYFLLLLVVKIPLISRVSYASTFAITSYSELDSYMCIIIAFCCHSPYSFLELSNLLKYFLICIYSDPLFVL